VTLPTDNSRGENHTKPVTPATRSHGEPLRTNHQRLADTFDHLRTIGAREDGAIDRRAFNQADMAARRWLIDEAESRGLQAYLDPAANVIVHGDSDSAPQRPVLTGSHLDSVPSGGAFDGALGVVIGFEVLTTLHEHGLLRDHPVELAAFSDEEGRFGGMLGSRAMAGLLTPEDISRAVDLDGVSLIDAMAEHGLDAERALDARRPPGAYRAYLEVHIEQGPVLERSRERLALVTDIAGLFKWIVTLRGESNHAGTTPMAMRRDTFQGVAEFACALDSLLHEHGSDVSMATIGNVSLHPGAANSVPGQAVFTLEARDTDPDTLDQLARAMRESLSSLARRRNLMFEFDEIERIDPVPCDPAVIRASEQATKALGLDNIRLHSGAAHDAQMIAQIAPMGMILTPSVAGRSHSAAEWTHREDVELAADTALQTILHLATDDAHELERRRPSNRTRKSA
jgi:N-carbamoyl-L-amino-acid hydrolase